MAPSTKVLALIILLIVSTLLIDCAGCSRSSERRSSRTHQTETATVRTEPTVEVTGSGPNVIALEGDGGVYRIPVGINGVPMKFILDTGASLISISEIEAGFLYKQGTIGEEDILEKVEFSDANGDISEGTIINLRSVQIGNRMLRNVRANVVSGGKAPLLLGQSALAQFGKVSLDYAHKTVSFD